MARKIYQIKPIDTGVQQGVGVLLPMNKSAHANDPNLNSITGALTEAGQDYKSASKSGASVFALSYSSEEQAISNLKNLLGTNRGERIMQPRFGTRIREAVFQPNTANLRDFIDESITEAIDTWLPYINLQGVDVIQNIDEHTFLIRVNFSVTETGVNRVIFVLANENNIQVTAEETDAPLALTEVGTFGDVFASGGY